jgi:hypothetical protein
MGAAGAVALVALVLSALALRRARRAESQAAALAVRVAVLESPVAAAPQPVVDDVPGTYVITGMGVDEVPTPEVPVARPVDGRLFADIVARESVVMAASWTHGLRRALSPASRNRIRFEVRQETRRATRQRRAETKQALREFRARERAGLGRDLDRGVGEDVA